VDLSAKIARAIKTYLVAFNGTDVDAILELFAENATVEDPAGTPVKEGPDAIRQFFKTAVRHGSQLEQTGKTRIVGNEAAFPFKVIVTMDSIDSQNVDVFQSAGRMEIDVIDTLIFNDDGKIKSMRAYWGPTNITHLDLS